MIMFECDLVPHSIQTGQYTTHCTSPNTLPNTHAQVLVVTERRGGEGRGGKCGSTWLTMGRGHRHVEEEEGGMYREQCGSPSPLLQ